MNKSISPLDIYPNSQEKIDSSLELLRIFAVHYSTVKKALYGYYGWYFVTTSNTTRTYTICFSVGCEVEADAKDMSIDLLATFCLDGACEADVKALTVKDVSYNVHVEVDIPGHQFLTDWIIDWVTNLFTNQVFKTQINDAVETELRKVIVEALNKLHV